MGRPERATPHGVYELRSKIYQPRTKVRSARQSENVNRKWERVAADGRRMECAKSDRLRKIKKGSWRQLLAVRQDRHFNKEQTPLASLRCQPTVSRWFSRCLEAHLGPLNCKIRFLVRAAICRSRAHHTGGQPMLACAKTSLSPPDITWMSLYVCSRSRIPLVDSSRLHSGKQKTLLTFVSRVGKNS